jgi:hypothetical protein
MLAADVLGEVSFEGGADLLRILFEDQNQDVKRAAIQAAV